MMRLAMSPPAAALLRSLLRRAGVDRNRILLTDFRSTDWQSLIFTGEQHMIRLRIPGPDAAAVAGHLLDGLDNADMPIPGHFVADIALRGDPETDADGSITLVLEALTVEE
jgi:hypothetical protein